MTETGIGFSALPLRWRPTGDRWWTLIWRALPFHVAHLVGATYHVNALSLALCLQFPFCYLDSFLKGANDDAC
jgi:hypothetical protein